MTKARIPHSFPDAMDKVKGLLGAAECARLATAVGSRAAAERTIYEWSNPDSGALPSLAQALAFDRAYRLAGGEDAPFRDAFAHQLEIEVEQADACRRLLAGELAEAAREAGEAQADAIVVATGSVSPLVIIRALSSVEEARTAFSRLAARISSFLPTGAGPAAGSNGGPST